MSIVEQASRRLEELRRGGIEVPVRTPPANGQDVARAETDLPVRAARQLERVHAPAVAPARDKPARKADDTSDGATGASRSKLVEIDLGRLAAMGYLTPKAARSQLGDDFRVIKRPLLLNAQGKSAQPVDNANVIMVTSALPGEGKTFVAINLAMSMAMELDRTVLLVDTDVSRPSVLSRLGLAPARGFLDVLGDASTDLSEVLLRTNIDKLTILPSGVPRPQATEILASDSMSRLLADVAARYPDRIVIFDSPPLLPSTESRVLATRMGQVILVVEAMRTPQKAVTQALSTVESCPMVMPLLNKVSRSEVGSYYGYYGPGEG